MKIYIVRHGKPEGIESRKRYLGITDEALSDEGMEQANELGAQIADIEGPSDVRIVSSPLIRCFETALVIKEHLNCEFVETDQRLREIDMGTWDGRYFDEIQCEYPEEYEARGNDLWNYKAPEGENFRETGERFKAVAEGLTKWAAEDDVIIIVSHAGAIRAGLSLMTDTPFDEWMNTKIPYASAAVFGNETGPLKFKGFINGYAQNQTIPLEELSIK